MIWFFIVNQNLTAWLLKRMTHMSFYLITWNSDRKLTTCSKYNFFLLNDGRAGNYRCMPKEYGITMVRLPKNIIPLYLHKCHSKAIQIWFGYLWPVSVVVMLNQLHVSLSAPVTSYRPSYGWTSAASDRPGHSRSPEHIHRFKQAPQETKIIWFNKPDIYHFADGASFLCPFLTTGCAEVCVHEAHLPRDGLGEHWQSGGVTSLSEKDWWGFHTWNMVQSF